MELKSVTGKATGKLAARYIESNTHSHHPREVGRGGDFEIYFVTVVVGRSTFNFVH